MATPMLRNQFSSITNLAVALRAVFYDQIAGVNGKPIAGDSVQQFFNRQRSSDAQEKNQGIGGFGNVPEYTGAIQYDNFELLYATTYQHKEYVQGMAVERKLVDDAKYGVINQRAQLLGLSFDRTREVHAASVFNNAFSSSYVGGDGKALCATDHPRSPNDATTQSNKGTTALSHDAVVVAETAMMGFTDSKGNPMNIVPDTLLVPVALRTTALTITGSSLKSGTANNDTNTLDGYRTSVSKYLTDANNWWLIDSRMALMFLNWFDRVSPEFKEAADSDYELELRYRGYMRHSFGWDHWAWIYGSEVA